MILSILTLATVLSAGEPDGVILTAPAGAGVAPVAQGPVDPQAAPASTQSIAHGLTTDEQIARWIEARREQDGGAAPFADEPIEERRVRGEVWAGIGTNGYRDVGGAVSIPIGESGQANLYFSKTENDFRRWYDPNRAGPLGAYSADPSFTRMRRPGEIDRIDDHLPPGW